MEELFAYHVVTDRPLTLGQTLLFDETHHNGVYQRVMEKLPEVNAIRQNPENFDAETLEYRTRVALRELALEDVRREHFPECPSRLGCLYVSLSPEESDQWAQYFISLGRPTYALVRIKITGTTFTGDAANCFDAVLDPEENRRMALNYWRNGPNDENLPPIKEILAAGSIQIVEILKEYNHNIP